MNSKKGIVIMQVTINKNDIYEYVCNLAKIAKASKREQTLESIKFDVDGQEVSLTAYNLEIGCKVKTVASAFSTDKFTFLVNAALLQSCLAKAPSNENITFDVSDVNVEIKYKKTKYKISTMDVNSFPEIPEVGNKTEQSEILCKDYIKGVNSTLYCSLAEESCGSARRYLGVNITQRDNETYFKTLDSYRAAQFGVESKNGNNIFTFTIPKDSARYIKDTVEKKSNEESKMSICKSDNLAVFNFAEYQIFTRTFCSEEFNFEGIKPTNAPAVIVEASKENLIEAIESVLPITENAVRNPLKISFDNDSLVLGCHSQVGKTEVNFVPDNMENNKSIEFIGVNVNFVLDALKAIDAESVTIKFMSAVSPIVIENDLNRQNWAIVLPMRIKA